MTKPREWRVLAVEAFHFLACLAIIYGDARAKALAREHFNTKCSGHDVQDVDGFIQRWGERFQETGSVDEAAHWGHHILPDEVADKCVDALFAGCDYHELKEGEMKQKHRPFHSIHDAVVNSEYIAWAVQQYDISEDTLARALQRRAPGLRRKYIRYKKVLSLETRLARVELCEAMLQKGEKKLRQYLRRVFWIDSKTFYIVPRDHCAYVLPGADLTIVDKRLPNSRSEIIKKGALLCCGQRCAGGCLHRVHGRLHRAREGPNLHSWRLQGRPPPPS